MSVKRIETIENVFVEQLKELLHNSFPKILGFDIEYFVGEDRGVRGIYFEIISKPFGIVYKKHITMKPYETIMDIEDRFMNEVINDFVLAGITFMNADSVRQKEERKMDDAIRKKKFIRAMPSRIIYLN